MDWTELRKEILKVKKAVIAELSKIYPVRESQCSVIFTNSQGVDFEIFAFVDPDFLVVEYKDTFEDGDCFFPEDYDTLEDMVNDMRKEIEQSAD